MSLNFCGSSFNKKSWNIDKNLHDPKKSQKDAQKDAQEVLERMTVIKFSFLLESSLKWFS